MMLRAKSSSMKPAGALMFGFPQAAIASTAKRPSTFSTLASCSTAVTPTMDPFDIANALSVAASASTPPSMGSKLHASTIKLGVSADTFTMNHLLIFYSRRRNLSSALDVFDECHAGTSSPGLPWCPAWCAVARLGWGSGCLSPWSGVGSARASLLSVARSVPACQFVEANAKLGLSHHGLAVKAGLDGNPYVESSLMLTYAKHGFVAATEDVFANIVFKDLACWNAMLEGYVSNGCGIDAMRTLVMMHRCGITPDVFTYIYPVKASSVTSELKFGQQLHGLVIQNMLESDTSVMNALVDKYFSAGLKEIAMAIFGKIRRKDTVSWNTMISGLAHDEDEKVAADCFVHMSRYGCKPNQVTFSVMLRLSGAKENASLGLQIFGLAYLHGYSDNDLVANAVINMLSSCGLLLNCAYGFCNLSARNVATWNEMIAGYALQGCSEDVMRLFRSLVCFDAKLDEFTYPAVMP